MNKLINISIKFAFSALLLLSLNNAYAAEDKAFIWEVKSKNSLVYLMGSVHFASADFYPLRPAINDAFSKSKNLVVEVDIANADPVQTQKLLLNIGTYAGTETLLDNIDKKTQRLLEQYVNKRGLPIEMFTRYKPGMLVITLTAMELMSVGLSAGQGIDLHFLNQARGQKQILELETLEQQLDLLINMGEGNQMLKQALEEFDTYPELISSLISGWQSGSVKQLEELLIHKPLREYPESKPAFERLFIDRNIKMTEKVKSYLASGESYFVVVGAGHLIGERGIVDLLQKAGFTVTRI